MRKYLNVFKISFAQEFAYRLNFIMWRVRNVLQILVLFFLWTTVFSDQGRVIFGYDKAKILTYVFGVLIVRALVFSARAVDVAGEISKGDLTILLLKPINYFRYWLTRDFSSKVLNLGFAVVEIAILFPLLKPAIFLQTNGYSLLGFAISLTIAVLLFFTILMATNFVTFWAPQVGSPVFCDCSYVRLLGGLAFSSRYFAGRRSKGTFVYAISLSNLFSYSSLSREIDGYGNVERYRN